jgi:hypothetical protein
VAVSIHRTSDGTTPARVARRNALPYADGLLSWTAGAVAVVALAVYLRTMLPSAAFWDTGEAQTVPHTLGIFHPTGFPTYTMLGWLWSQLPIGGVAWRMNLFSGVCIALSAGLAVLITGHLIDERHRALRATAAAIAGLAFAFASEPWRNAVRADVHALNTLFVALIIWLLFCWREAEWGGAPRAGRWLMGAALTFGIALGNHPLAGLLAFGIAAWLFIVDPGIWRRWRLVLACGGLLLLGLATYLYIPIRALTPPEPPLFYARPTTLERLRYIVFAEQFHGLFSGFANILGNLDTKWSEASGVLGEQFTAPGWLIAAVGAATLATRQFGALLFLSLVVLADILYAMNFEDGDIARYYIPAVLAVAPLIGVAIAMLAGACARAAAEVSRRVASIRGRRRLAALAGFVVLALGVSLPAGSLVMLYDKEDQSDDRIADEWVASVYAQLPPDAAVISWWSYSTPLWYHRWVLGDRPDVKIIDDRNILDDGYGTIDGAIGAMLAAGRPVFVVATDYDRPRITATWVSEDLPTIGGFAGLIHILSVKG